jgi:lipopolysaccharide/colanic/teichoic acid biosynthesis glycosyltransferase
LYFVGRKVNEPLFPTEPSYGPIVKLERIGKNGKMIKVYKLRTMHPYAEYIQEYVYKKDGLAEGGKFNNDFRVSTMGKFFRALWLDEFPSLINLIKGDLKLFGVRPLSKHYFSLYTPELQEKRIKYKPGLVPPFYVDLPKTLKEIMESEMKYLNAYDKHPFRTDFRYFFIAMFNIIFRRYRSK